MGEEKTTGTAAPGASLKPGESPPVTVVNEVLALGFLEETRNLDTPAFLLRALQYFGPGLSFATSLGLEDQVLLDLLDGLVKQNQAAPDVFTLDTGRLPEETWELYDANRARYALDIRVCFPAAMDISELVAAQGARGFRNSVEERKACCRVRKVLPLKKALAGKTAWMTGQRREQSVTRSDLERVEWDSGNQVIKLNPLADWSLDQVLAYIKEHQVPVSSLHARGFPSIGCAPCTRGIKPGEDERAGRWWWENPEHKECGLHGGNKNVGKDGAAGSGVPGSSGGIPGRFGFGNLET